MIQTHEEHCKEEEQRLPPLILSYAQLKSEGQSSSFDPSMSLAEAKRLDEHRHQANRLKPITTIKAGELVAFTTGEYSDYSVVVLLRAKSDFTNDDMLDALANSGAVSEPKHRHDGFDESKMIAYLANLECFEEVQARSIHLGDYGALSVEDEGYLTNSVLRGEDEEY